MSPQEHLEFLISHYEAKYPHLESPMIWLTTKTAEELIDAFKLAKKQPITREHFVMGKRKIKKLMKMGMLEAA